MQRKAGVNYPSLHPALPPAWSWGLEIAGFAVIKANSWFCLVRKTTRCCLEKPEKSWKRFSFPLPGVGKERLFHVKQGWAPPSPGAGTCWDWSWLGGNALEQVWGCSCLIPTDQGHPISQGISSGIPHSPRRTELGCTGPSWHALG